MELLSSHDTLVLHKASAEHITKNKIMSTENNKLPSLLFSFKLWFSLFVLMLLIRGNVRLIFTRNSWDQIVIYARTSLHLMYIPF